MLIPLVFSMLLHPVHETTSEVEWNAESRRIEVALRLDVLDEQWLRRQSSGKAGQSDWIVRYLRQKYRIAELPKRGEEDSTRYHWIGREVEGSHVWWYFEIEPIDGTRPEWIDVRVLQNRETNYTHQILLLGQKPHRSMTLSMDRPRKQLWGQLDSRSEPSGEGRNTQPSSEREAATDR